MFSRQFVFVGKYLWANGTLMFSDLSESKSLFWSKLIFKTWIKLHVLSTIWSSYFNDTEGSSRGYGCDTVNDVCTVRPWTTHVFPE